MSKKVVGGRIRGERSDKKCRVNPSIDQIAHEKLDRLSMAVGITKTSMAAFMIDLCLNNENIINFIQDQFKDYSKFRIIPAKDGDQINFIFTEKKISNRTK